LQKPEGRRGLLPASRPALGDYLLLKRRHRAEVLTYPNGDNKFCRVGTEIYLDPDQVAVAEEWLISVTEVEVLPFSVGPNVDKALNPPHCARLPLREPVKRGGG
jgi:hypothetical protein